MLDFVIFRLIIEYQNAKQSVAIPPTPPTTLPTMVAVSSDADAGAAGDVPAGMDDAPLVELEGEDGVLPVGVDDYLSVAVDVDDTPLVEPEEEDGLFAVGVDDCPSAAVDVDDLASRAFITLPCSMAYP